MTEIDEETEQVLDILEAFMIREMGQDDADRAMQVVLSLMERARLSEKIATWRRLYRG